MTFNKDECCPEFNKEKWDEKTFDWDNKPFIKDSIPAIFHIPLYLPLIGKKITKMWKMTQGANQAPEDMAETLVLFHDPHPFKSELFLSVNGEVPGAKNVTISGKFISKVFDGPYNAVPKFIKEMEKYLEPKDKKAKDYYVHYAYCPKCAKEKGNNYMILFAKV